MRIIAGSCRGKKLFTPTDNRVRPTADRAREAVFSILISKLPAPLSSYRFMDIFSGTGAFGLEACSRGAKHVTFVDINLNLTKKNVAACGFKNVDYINKDARLLPHAREKADIIFMDAPYNLGLSTPVLEALIKQSWLKEDSLIITETANDEELILPKELELIDERIYGAARFSFLVLKA